MEWSRRQYLALLSTSSLAGCTEGSAPQADPEEDSEMTDRTPRHFNDNNELTSDVKNDTTDTNNLALGATHTGVFSPFYAMDDFGDNNATSTRSGVATTQYVNPTDGALTAEYRPQWTLEGGSASAANQEMTVGSGGGYVSIPTTHTTGSWEIHFRFDTAPSSGELQTFLRRKDASNQWRVRTQDTGSLLLDSDEGGTNSTLVSSSWPVDTNPHTIRAERTRDGDWELFFDGVSEGTAADTFVPDSSAIFGFYNGCDTDVTIQHVNIE